MIALEYIRNPDDLACKNKVKVLVKLLVKLHNIAIKTEYESQRNT